MSEARKYDFRRPQKFSKEHIRALELVHENFCRLVSNYLSYQLRTTIKVTIQSVEQISYEEFINNIPNSTILIPFKMEPLNGNLLFEMDTSLAFKIIDVSLGGSGNRASKIRELTDIDRNILDYIISNIINNLKKPWESIVDVSIDIGNIETNPSLNQTLSLNEPVALIKFDISTEIEDEVSNVNLCIPYISIKSIVDKLENQYWFQSVDENILNQSKKNIKENIELVKLNMKAELGKATVCVDDFLKLSEGDIVKLDKKVVEPIDIYVEDIKSYHAIPGIIDEKKGISIINTLDGDVKEDER
jgi:flagellar motor switch protein FliM